MLDNLTQRLTALVSKIEPVGFDLKFDLAENGIIHVAAKESPVVVSNTDGQADTTLKLSAEDLEQLLDRKLNPTTAFMFGKIKIDGDMSKAMSLTKLFA